MSIIRVLFVCHGTYADTGEIQAFGDTKMELYTFCDNYLKTILMEKYKAVGSLY